MPISFIPSTKNHRKGGTKLMNNNSMGRPKMMNMPITNKTTTNNNSNRRTISTGISWYSILISKQNGGDEVLRGYFNVNNATNKILSFYNYNNPTVNILMKDNSAAADYLFINNNFTLGGINISTISTLEKKYNYPTEWNLWYDPTSDAPNDVSPYTNISYRIKSGSWEDITPYGTIFAFTFTSLPSEPPAEQEPYIFFTYSPSIITSPILPKTPRFFMQSLFSDNSLVCYKNHSLPSCGVGTVKNSRHKAICT